MSDQPVSTPSVLGGYAVELARGGAALIRQLDPRGRRPDDGVSFLDAGGVETKSTSTDLVTTIDRAVERWLVDRLTADRPDDAVLGEEGGGRSGSTGVRWLLDPIDGTVNFVLGLPSYAVSVAAEVDGQVVAGAVCNPVTGELFRATLGGGAWLGERRLHGPRDIDLARAVIATGFGYDRAARTEQAAAAAVVLSRVADIRRIGSAALDLCSVAHGRLDGYYEIGLHPWDYAAGALVATEAGCLVTGLRGRPISGRMTVAGRPELVADLVTLLEELYADEVDEAGDDAGDELG